MIAGTDYFESDVSTHPCVIMAPSTARLADGTTAWRMRLLAQGAIADVAHQLATHYESFRVLLRKHRACPGPVPDAPPAMLERFTLQAGSWVVLVPTPGGTPSPYMRTVAVLGMSADPASAERIARDSGLLALVAEVLVVEQAELAPTAWLRWDNGNVEFPAA